MQPLQIANKHSHLLLVIAAVILVFVSGFHPLMHTHPVAVTCEQDCCGQPGFDRDCNACLIAFVTPAIPGEPPMPFVPVFDVLLFTENSVVTFNSKTRIFQARAPPTHTGLSV